MFIVHILAQQLGYCRFWLHC